MDTRTSRNKERRFFFEFVEAKIRQPPDQTVRGQNRQSFGMGIDESHHREFRRGERAGIWRFGAIFVTDQFSAVSCTGGDRLR